MTTAAALYERAKRTRLLILDVDGVLTDGRVLFGPNGEQSVFFNIQDGQGLVSLQKNGLPVAIISGRHITAVKHRLTDLGIKSIHLGIDDKLEVFESLLREYQLNADQVAYVGDDTQDIAVMQQVGFAIAVSNAVPTVKQMSHWQTSARGGHGAVREVCDLLSTAKKLDHDILHS